ncbi:TIGR04197 family type VII secretion effector [Heyndrickxia faecalis]|uniref:TIGR04197 family type VII secretion effector n=1 Tax=Heyndrickxia TaxID=2837504 RepID=UPI0005571286|nr:MULTISPECIES: TIGR04197 family type VII secretion effector [Heyndrickxia]NMH85602.1 YwqI/YxiC family protein [Heyndrickxia coagulans]NWN95080.1 TIGR04197 family type VII secretion effector [Bacillus sp. (in: firmicutes)]KGT39941.1 hypothetical protein P421_02520 [Heyndrickxia coagulans P38]MED4320742.1 TIGR04197 family type VII secretion effector [Weizmannia sp. CD-2023]MED4839512.1 TIGR04197 family type VII secretion effector [Weizmannia sp. CD-2023]
MAEIAINETVFNATLSQAESVKTALEGLHFPEPAMHQTDLKSLKEQMEVLKELKTALKLYSALLQTDLQKLEQLGKEMVQQDEKIGQSFAKLAD